VLNLVGVEPIAARRTQKLSGGETHRLRLALALVSNPELLILDEPTVAMDAAALRKVRRAPREHHRRPRLIRGIASIALLPSASATHPEPRKNSSRSSRRIGGSTFRRMVVVSAYRER
jgi:Fe-S cluster assembly ATPase SufC